MSSSPTTAREAIDLSVRVGDLLREHVGEKNTVATVSPTDLARWFPEPDDLQEALRLHELSQGWKKRRRARKQKVVPMGDYITVPLEVYLQELQLELKGAAPGNEEAEQVPEDCPF